MDDLPSAPDARARLELRAITELLKAQRRRIRSHAQGHEPPPRGPVRSSVPPGIGLPTGREVLDALPVPALLLAPVPGDDGEVVDVHCTGHNAAAAAYAAERFPDGPVPRGAGRVPLYERFPSLHQTPVPRMISRARRDHHVQGPEAVEWVVNGHQDRSGSSPMSK